MSAPRGHLHALVFQAGEALVSLKQYQLEKAMQNQLPFRCLNADGHPHGPCRTLQQWADHLGGEATLERRPLVDTAGHPITSVNDLSGVVKRAHRIAKRKRNEVTQQDMIREAKRVEEVKTTAQDVSVDAAILAAVAHKAKMVVVSVSGDGYKMFLQ
jgi:hypothetical protein